MSILYSHTVSSKAGGNQSMDGIRLIWAMGMGLLLLSSCDDPPTSVNDTLQGSDTFVATDTATEEDTPSSGDAASGDTASPVDTVQPSDTSQPSDTRQPGDTASSSDTASPQDTHVPPLEGPPVCLGSCTVAADCVEPNAVDLVDEDNYACDTGVCRWLGCNSDAECLAGYLCRHIEGALPLCYPPCSVPGDCAFAGSEGTAYDDDNYACESGVCRWQGCNTDAECQAFDSNHVCHTATPTLDLCRRSCTTAADCDEGAGSVYDANNYTCEAGVCRWLGCASDDECVTDDLGARCVGP